MSSPHPLACECREGIGCSHPGYDGLLRECLNPACPVLMAGEQERAWGVTAGEDLSGHDRADFAQEWVLLFVRRLRVKCRSADYPSAYLQTCAWREFVLWRIGRDGSGPPLVPVANLPPPPDGGVDVTAEKVGQEPEPGDDAAAIEQTEWVFNTLPLGEWWGYLPTCDHELLWAMIGVIDPCLTASEANRPPWLRDELMSLAADVAQVRPILAEVPPDERYVLLESALGGRSLKEAGNDKGWREDRTHQRMSRLRNRLKDRLVDAETEGR